VVRFGEVSKGQRKIYVTADNGDEKEYSVPRAFTSTCRKATRLSAGDPLMDGPLNPHDILAVLGEKALQALPGERDSGGLPSAGRGHQ